jgi:Fe-S cluster assembly protein SufD
MVVERVIKRVSEPGRTSEQSPVHVGEIRFTPDSLPLPPGIPTFLDEYRRRAWNIYRNLPMPNQRDEAWRRTDLRRLQINTFDPSIVHSASRKPPQAILRPLITHHHGGRIVLTAQGAQRTIEEGILDQGVIFTDILEAAQKHPQVLEKVLGQTVRPEEGKFAALAASMLRNGVLVYVPRGVQVTQPLHSVLWGGGAGSASFSHLLIWLEDDASLTLVHESSSADGEGQALHAGIVEIHVGEGADLHFVELQSWGRNVWNFTHERVVIQQGGNLDWVFGALGSRVTKNFSTLDLVGSGAVGRMSGFYFTDGEQHLDHDTQQNHLAPDTTSDLLFKGALKGRSRSVWQGMIYVAPGAQKADGYQANRNLVLSPQARADSIPGLEILANDVRCTHGATVGKVDAEQVFFLQARGIPKPEAERLIVEGFFEPIMERIPFDGVRTRFRQAIQQKMMEQI